MLKINFIACAYFVEVQGRNDTICPVGRVMHKGMPSSFGQWRLQMSRVLTIRHKVHV